MTVQSTSPNEGDAQRLSRDHLPLERLKPGLRILYLGDDTPTYTALHRALALRRLGHEVTIINPQRFAAGGELTAKIDFRTGYRFTRARVGRQVLAELGSATFDLVWVGGGAVIGPALVCSLRERARVVINYNNDDPLGGWYGRRWSTWRKALPEYDLAVVLREINIDESLAAGARKVHRVWMTYDETIHHPYQLSLEEQERYASEVVFVGTWMPERGPFLAELVRRGVPLSIYGGRWSRAPEWRQLSSSFKAPWVGDEEYAKVIQSANISLGLLSVGNRDQHTRRSVEVPAIGGLLCAQRTGEHQALFKEGEEAVFWSDAKECAKRCLELLAEPDRAQAVAEAGRRRILELRLGNEDLGDEVLRVAGMGRPE
jgi:spore maturation protein CgeB